MPKDPLAELARILAKAENNPNAHEAELAFERATKLSARYGIDLAVARAHLVGKEREKPTKEKVKVGDPTRRDNKYLMELFTDIAMANDLRCMIQGEHLVKKNEAGRHEYFERYSRWQREELDYLGLDPKNPEDLEEIEQAVGEPEESVRKTQFKDSIYCTMYGFPSDIEMAKKLYAVAVVMMTSTADRALRAGQHKDAGANAKAWRTNFYIGFTHRLNARLWEIKREAEREAALELDSGSERSTALVLADKKEEVEDFFKKENQEHFYRADGTEKKGKNWSGADTKTTSWDARAAGSNAADRVNLGTDDNALGAASRRGIGA